MVVAAIVVAGGYIMSSRSSSKDIPTTKSTFPSTPEGFDNVVYASSGEKSNEQIPPAEVKPEQKASEA